MRLTEYGFGCDGADPTGALGGGARAASSIQPVALLFKSWIWAKPALRPITRKGRPAGKPYKTGAEEDGLASTPMGCLETRIMFEPGISGCSAWSTASSACSGSSIASPVGFFCSFGGVAASCAGTDDWEPVTVGPTGDVAAAVGGDGGCGTESVVAAGGNGGWMGDSVDSGVDGAVAGGEDGVTATGAFCSTSGRVK